MGSHSVGLGWGLSFCIPHKLRGDALAADPQSSPYFEKQRPRGDPPGSFPFIHFVSIFQDLPGLCHIHEASHNLINKVFKTVPCTK